MKIHVTGNAGSGKTTLAKELGEILDIEVYGLDKVVWQAGWQKTPINERKQLEKKLTEKTDWVIDGVSSISRKKSDIIIFLDYPRYICMFRGIKRSIKYLFKTRPELPENCPEIKIIPSLIKIIWQFPKVAKPAILDDIKNKKGVRVSNKAELQQFLNSVRHNKLSLLDAFGATA